MGMRRDSDRLSSSMIPWSSAKFHKAIKNSAVGFGSDAIFSSLQNSGLIDLMRAIPLNPSDASCISWHSPCPELSSRLSDDAYFFGPGGRYAHWAPVFLLLPYWFKTPPRIRAAVMLKYSYFWIFD
jgi:hypothetical protein